MADTIQIIRSPAGEELVVLSRAAYDRLCRHTPIAAMSEDESDARTARLMIMRVKSGKETLVPGAVVSAMVQEDTHPIKAWRIYRGMTAAALAKKAGISRAYLTQIETRARTGTIDKIQKLAVVLATSVDNLLEENTQLSDPITSQPATTKKQFKKLRVTKRALKKHLAHA